LAAVLVWLIATDGASGFADVSSFVLWFCHARRAAPADMRRRAMAAEAYPGENERAELRRKERREGLLKEYGEIGANFRTLTDIRFRLLSLLPIATAAASAFKPEGTALDRIPFALFGLGVTLALIAYNKRNDQLYNELVGRAGSIERELGIPDGAFANRPHTWLAVLPRSLWVINHGGAIGTIYLATVSFWLFMALEGIGVAAARLPPGAAFYAQFMAFLGESWRPHAGGIMRVAIFAAAVGLPLLALARLRRQEKNRKDEVSDEVKKAGARLFLLEQRLLDALPSDRKSLPAVAAVPTEALLAELIADEEFVRSCAIARKAGGNRDGDTVKDVLRYLRGSFDDAPSSGSVRQPDPARAAHVLSVIVGLPPRYVRARLPASAKASVE